MQRPPGGAFPTRLALTNGGEGGAQCALECLPRQAHAPPEGMGPGGHSDHIYMGCIDVPYKMPWVPAQAGTTPPPPGGVGSERLGVPAHNAPPLGVGSEPPEVQAFIQHHLLKIVKHRGGGGA